jgi:LysM repeat protein
MLQAPRIVRWTLPALLLTLVVGGYAIVAASGVQGDSKQDTSAPATTSKKKHKAKRVMVHTGDTVASIARHAHLTVVELLDLNPKVDPRTLQPGQRLKIKR